MLALVSIFATSGCLDVLYTSTKGVQLGELHLQNMHEESHRLDVELKRNEELVVDRVVSLDGESKEVIEPSWSAEPGQYTLTVEIDGAWNPTVKYGDDDSLEEGCPIVYITIAPDGVPAIGTSPSSEISGECPR